MATKLKDWLGADVGYETDNRFPTADYVNNPPTLHTWQHRVH